MCGTFSLPKTNKLNTSTKIKNNIKRELDYSEKNLKNIREAMRETVLSGTTQSLNFDFVKIATKSGTAQIKNNTRVNSWVIGF